MLYSRNLKKVGEPYSDYCPSGRVIYFQRYKCYQKPIIEENIIWHWSDDTLIDLEIKQAKEDMDIKKNVLDILSRFAWEEKVKMEDNLRDDLWFDSLDCVEVIMDVEKEFDITIPDEEAEKCRIVQDVVEMVESKLKGKR